MSPFKPVTLQWKGQDYKVEPKGVLELIAQIEGVITLGELYRFTSAGNMPLAKLAMAFGTALRHAGARVTDEDVYAAMFGGDGADMRDVALSAVVALQSLMIPPETLRDPGKAKAGKAQAAGKRAASSPSTTGS